MTRFGRRPGDTYVDRGDTASWDFLLAAFTTDNNWHDLNLSSIVPARATTIHIRLFIRAPAANKTVELGKAGQSQFMNEHRLRTQIANQRIDGSYFVSCDALRRVQYRAANTTWTAISLVVLGWLI